MLNGFLLAEKDCTLAGTLGTDACWDLSSSDQPIEKVCLWENGIVKTAYPFMKKYVTKYYAMGAHSCNKAACADCAKDPEGSKGTMCMTVAGNVCQECCTGSK